MSTIVVFGGTGYAGSAIVREALSRGHEVVAVARDTSKLDAAEHLTLAQGDAFDAGFVSDVTKGADVVIVSLHAVQSDGSELKDKFQHFVDAAEAAGARLGIVGGAGSMLVAEGGPALYDTPDFPDAFKGEAKSHGQILEALRAGDTSVDWFYVSPAAAFGGYNPGERRGTYRSSDDVLLADAEGNSDISGADYAIAVVDEIEQPKHHQARFGVAY
ncbi:MULTISPECIES: NAD(P)-dependent oxidoreductase [Curtobacterium]|uniref:NAD(P)-dependent oxidoreductase n=1 Tax=Curtobacterium TaxID=2034 RepID=UPI0015E8A0B4|nr:MULTISPECIES: NAD(P)H-binding protein [Curtobacterium]MBY0177745.1 NAD(P)H-binding protein [Curtobacterium herbarum]MCP1501602.1 putative NADH-flavin reductase [Curtobacterium herbarum]MDN3478349.1 NAD(P)H-binding protein [Curtobacterium sp. APC 4022]MDN4648265.1 NAD(P)H-binding protein [Curtobacterium sp. PsM8]WIE62821.1 NAD(P)H-binding protein [Curtobacterium sp. MCLR17_032]